MPLSGDLNWRGLIKDKTFDDVKWLDKPRAFYLGIDASAPSLTVGNLAIILLARRLSDAGWKTVLLMGGGTSLVGDPGGKLEERQLKSREEIQQNIAGIKEQVKRLFRGENFELVDNYDWLSKLGFMDFLREHGKRFSMTELMQREFVTTRMGNEGKGISYAEFSYGLAQGYDYYVLNDKSIFNGKELDVELQIGGSDQWSNMLIGVAMIRKKKEQEVHALSMPLVINKASGIKFGKSEEGAIWLDAAQTTPTQFYQFWINTDDEDVEEYLKVFTFLARDEIESITAQHLKEPGKRLAQTKLAEAVTEIVHGEGTSASEVSKYLTNQASIAEANEDELKQIREEVSSLKVQPQVSLAEVLVETGLASSNSDARRLMDSGAVYVNSKPFTGSVIDKADFENGRLLLRRGKAFKDSALIELE